MSGAIFAPLEGPGALDAASGPPLVCPLCRAQYEHPCLLDCFHDFCAGCLRGRTADGRLTCPLCQHQTVVKGPSGLPPVDRLLQFLVDSSGDGMEVVRCANCDQECGKQDAETTYFCNTCGQPLCARCRDETHRARMFARHDIVALGQRSRDVLQKCSECGVPDGDQRWAGMGAGTGRSPHRRRRPTPTPAAALHAEPYIMFSTDKKSLLCIRCFRDMQGQSRAHCVDLESAYVQGCERLQQAMLAVKALQTATREAIALLQAMVDEVRRSAADEEAAIHALFGSMQDKLAERKALLLQAVQSQYEEKDKAFKEQLSHLATLLPTLQRLQAEMQNLKDQVQELHRDLTKHHSLIKAEIMGDILHKSLQVDTQIALEYASVEGMRAVFQEIWEESYERVANEQEIYEDGSRLESKNLKPTRPNALAWAPTAQLHDLLQLKQENAYLTTITKQITPYVRSIAKVKERLEPRFQAPVDEPSDHLQNTHDDGVNGEAQARNDPAGVSERREKTSEPRNSRTLSSLAEEPPLKNKDAHRPKPKNGGDVPTWRERPA
ncbi:RING finger protein 207 isoform X12 [Kogia breviceps]|uniref:RING finger protein 207 isoform X12 n=1 Tax=Kogia breviceps TaxID=27615 RepID=UPI0034D1CD23